MLCWLERFKQQAPVRFTTNEYIPFNLGPTLLGQGYKSALFALDSFFISAKRKVAVYRGLE
jgi:hypothetical protein